MSTIVTELYDALRQAGVEQELAQLEAHARMDLATKNDMLALKHDMLALKTELRTDMARDLSEMKVALSEMKVELIRWNVGAMAVLTGIFAAIVRLN